MKEIDLDSPNGTPRTQAMAKQICGKLWYNEPWIGSAHICDGDPQEVSHTAGGASWKCKQGTPCVTDQV